MNRLALAVGALVTVPLLVFLAISLRSDPRRIDSPLIGRPAPVFALPDLDGQIVSLEELRGKPVLINFWATWCQPCLVEHPVLQAGAERYRDQVHFLGVVYQDDPQAIRRFVERRGAWGPSLVDDGVKVALAYGVYGAPETFFIDRQGTIVDKVAGALDPAGLKRRLDALL